MAGFNNGLLPLFIKRTLNCSERRQISPLGNNSFQGGLNNDEIFFFLTIIQIVEDSEHHYICMGSSKSVIVN